MKQFSSECLKAKNEYICIYPPSDMMDLNIRKELFWDIDPKLLDQDANKSLVIDRVLSLGNLDELSIIFHYYGQDTIISIVRRLGYLDPKTFSFVVGYLGIPKEEMKCFIKKQSNQQHWD